MPSRTVLALNDVDVIEMLIQREKNVKAFVYGKGHDCMRDFHQRILSLAARIVGAHVGHNDVPTDSIPNMIRNVYGALAELAASQPGAGEDDHPHHGHDHTHHHDGQALNHAQDAHRHSAIGQTVFDDHLVCMECGLSMKMLKRHLLTVHALSPDAYRAKWGLPADYPMVAAVYAKLRSSLALESGLGLKPEDRSSKGRKVHGQSPPAAAR